MSDNALAAIENLRQYQGQLDEDGIYVGVSRQALEETLAYIAALESELADYKQRVATWNSGANSCAVYKLEAENKRLRERVAELENALTGMVSLDESYHQRGYDDEDVCCEVRTAYDALYKREVKDNENNR